MAIKTQQLDFASETLIFYYESAATFRIGAYSYSEEDMGKASFTCDLYASQEIVPGFSFNWKLELNGERFVLKTLMPAAIKDTSSVEYKYTVVFSSEREDLSRFPFANLVSGTQPAVSYDFGFVGDIAQFAERFNLNLASNLGDRWIMIVSEGVTSSSETVQCDNIKLFALLQKVYEIYGLRWRIYYDAVLEKMVILIINEQTDAIEISHEFEYGYQKGLIEIERTNSTENVTTRLSGLGGTKNVPPSYFHPAVSIYAADPDRNEHTDLTYYTNVMPKCYRDYVQGWNGKTVSVQSPAYLQGVADKVTNTWNPVDYIDSANKDLYGIWKDVLTANEEIFPTIQGMTDSVLGRLDQVVAVESVLNDIYDSDEDDSSVTKNYEDVPLVTISQYLSPNTIGIKESITSAFSITESDNKVSFNVTQLSGLLSSIASDYETLITVSLLDGTTAEVVDYMEFPATVSESIAKILEFSGEFNDIALGEYFLKIEVSATNQSYEVNLTTEINTIKVYNFLSESVSTKYKQTFDIWIKNIWGTTFQDSEHLEETEAEYVSRVWDPLTPSTIQGEMKIMWSSGLLAGEDYEFTVNKISYNNDVTNSHWKLTLIKSDADLEATDKYLPNRYQNAVVGDSFFFINIVLPQSYIYSAEEQVENYLLTELAKVDTELPSYTCKPSEIFCAGFSEVDKIRAGSRILLKDVRLVGTTATGFYITSVNLEYTDSSVLPSWTIVISDKVTAAQSSVSTLQGDVKRLSNNVYSNEQTIQQVVKQFDKYFLRKDGLSQSSESPTAFNKGITFGKNLVSNDFSQGFLTGSGAGIFRDASGNTILEIDRLSVRKTLEVNELIINQTTFYGGKYLYSAAGMEVVRVEEDTDIYRCYMDTKQGTRLNQFAVNDQAFCQRFASSGSTVIKNYWRLVVAVGSDYIDLSKTDCIAGSGVPEAGDNISQAGNRTDTARQSLLIIDQISGGSVVQYAGINSYSWLHKNYVGYGINPSTGEAFLYSYGNMFIGDRDMSAEDSTWITFQQKEGDTKKKLYVRAALEIGAGSSGLTNLSEWAGIEQRFQDLEENISFTIDLSNENASVACDAGGAVTGTLPSSQAYVFAGSTLDTGWAFSGLFTGCTGSIDEDTGVITITGLSEENGTVVITATKAAHSSLVATFTMTKVRSGNNVVTYYLLPSVNVIKLINGVFAPTTITCDQMMQSGSSEPTVTTDKIVAVEQDGSGTIIPISTFEGGIITLAGNISFLDFYLYDTDETTILDKQRVPVISNGVDGIGAITIVMTNEAHTLPSSSAGVVSSYVGSGVAFRAWQGMTELLVDNSSPYAPGTFRVSDAIAYSITAGSTSPVDGSVWQTYGVCSAMSNSSDLANISFVITVVTLQGEVLYFNRVQSFSKSKTGSDAIIYSVEPSVNIIKRSTAGVATPTTITCAKMKQIGSSAPVVTTEKTLKYSINGGTESTYASELTILSSWSYIDFILYDGTTVLDKERVPIISDGASNYYLSLTNDNASAACNSEGVVIGTLPSSQAMVYYGAELQTGWAFSATFVGCTGSINSGTGIIAVTALSADNATVTVTATKTDSPTLTIVFTITKVKGGADAVIYSVEPSVNIIKIANDGVITPTTITCTKIKQIGSSLPAITTEKTLKYSVDSGAESNYSSAITIIASWSYIDFILYDGTTVLDKERVLIVIDGTDAANTAKETMARLLGYASLAEMEAALANSTTIIENGHIRTQLLEAFSVLANNLSTSATFPAITISKRDNALQMFDSTGALKLKISGENLSPIGTTGNTFACNIKNKTISMPSGHGESTLLFTGGNTLATIHPVQANNQVIIPETWIEFSCTGMRSGDSLSANCSVYLGSLLLNYFSFDTNVQGSQETFTLPATTISVAANADTLMTVVIDYAFEVSAGNTGFSMQTYISYASATGSISYQDNMIEMSKSGMRVMYASNKYMEASFNSTTSVMTLIMRNGNYGFSVTDAGLKKMINGTDWVAL